MGALWVQMISGKYDYDCRGRASIIGGPTFSEVPPCELVRICITSTHIVLKNIHFSMNTGKSLFPCPSLPKSGPSFSQPPDIVSSILRNIQ